MAIPTYDQTMPPLLRLAAQHEELVMRDAIQAMADHFALTEKERAATLPKSSETYIYDRTYWARVSLIKADLLESPRRGVVRITQAGREFLKRNPGAFDLKALKPLSKAAKQSEAPLPFSRPVEPDPVPAEAEAIRKTPQERIAEAEEALSRDLREQLQEQLQKISPAFFERLIVDLMLAMGYGFDESSGRQLGRTNDGGIDGEIYEDKLGLDRILLQAKRYAAHVSIGSPQIREFIGSLDVQGVSKGVFVTTSSFTEEARRTPKAGGKRLVLIDGARLADLMIEHGVGVRVERSVVLKALDLNYFEDA
ncbi:restriction endonuclease [Neomegalonema sp.]|uniref:restriction endonuclease n=1 Tax=Neomegalonema sp. TaxID=2039713 RepID=UPI002618A5FD|nr:restriction endonuclease [Neomegalonema sp.]MDD2868268.1 restriction endonuclease [Neomegalonema sp.]